MVHSPPRGIRNEKEACWDGKNANGTYKRQETTKHKDQTPQIHGKAKGKAEKNTTLQNVQGRPLPEDLADNCIGHQNWTEEV